MAKNENEKHDHKWTKLLKVGIFAAMMLAPLIAIGVKCAYVTFNKNAKDSYSGTTNETYNEAIAKYPTNEINSENDFIVGNYYYYECTTKSIEGNEKYLVEDNAKDTIKLIDAKAYIGDRENYVLENLSTPYDYFAFATFLTINESSPILINADDTSDNYSGILKYNGKISNDENTNYKYYFIIQILDLDFNKSVGAQYLTKVPDHLQVYESEQVTIESTTLDNVFYYAVDQMKENELFNWTRNTAIYNGVNAVTTGLGITTDAIPILLVYWILLTLIYVIFDIVIETFTWLTHLFSNKVIK